MATLTVQNIANTGLNPSLASAAGSGDEFANSGQTYFHANNASGGAITVTFNAQNSCNYGVTHDIAVSVPAGEERLIGPFEKQRFNDANERVQVTYSGVTSLTVGAFEMP